MQGWIMLHRKVKEHWLFTEKRTFTKFEAWIDLLLEVNHKDNKFMLGSELVEVKRGQTITSVRQLCERWNWSNTKVTKFLKMLESDEMLAVKSDTKKTVITIANYDVYQVKDIEKTTEKRQLSDTETSQKHTNNNDNNDNNEKKESSRQKFIYEPSDMELAELLFNYIQDNGDKAYHLKNSEIESWANTIRLMRTRDKRTHEGIKYLIDWTQKDEFWRTVILSPSKLREKFDQLVIKVKQQKEKQKPTKEKINWEDL